MKWLEHFLTQDYPIAKPSDDSFGDKQSFLCLWENGLYSDAVKNAKQHFDITNGITLCFKRDGYSEYFCFASSRENLNIVGFYLNHLDVLEAFSKFFLEKAHKMIEMETEHKIYIPNDGHLINMDVPVINQKNDFDSFSSEEFVPSLINNPYGIDIQFTKNEIRCLTWLRKGLTAKEMGMEMDLSHRTVEDYINSIKYKLNCDRKSQIIRTLDSIQLFHTTIGKKK
jgi:DNA-binding CsgD family transcriptional regulator